MFRIPFFHRFVNGSIQCGYFGHKLVDDAFQLPDLTGQLHKPLPLLLDEAFQLFHLPLFRWQLPHAPGYQILELLGERVSLLPLDQLCKLV